MNKTWKKCLILGFIIVGLAITYTVMANPGSDSDPVISLSYLNEIFKPEVKSEVEQATSFQVVPVSAGQTLIGNAGTELIMRMGTATIVATDMGGLADVTAGYDLSNGSAAPSNHHLIVPKADGRGVYATSDCLIMVKGAYQIQ